MSTARPLAGLSILLVEDEDDARDMLAVYLTYEGATITTDATAADALQRFKAAPPAIVLTDIAMPHHDGVWLLEQIRAIPGGLRVPVVALTALAMKQAETAFTPPGSTVTS